MDNFLDFKYIFEMNFKSQIDKGCNIKSSRGLYLWNLGTKI